MPSRLEDDLRTKPDAAVMLRLKLRDSPVPAGQNEESGSAAGPGAREGSGSNVAGADRAITLVCWCVVVGFQGAVWHSFVRTVAEYVISA